MYLFQMPLTGEAIVVFFVCRTIKMYTNLEFEVIEHIST